MNWPAVIAILVTAGQAALSAATVETRDGKSQSGSLQQISAKGVQVNGRTISWEQIRWTRLAPAPGAKAELRRVNARIWRGTFTSFKEAASRDPSTLDNARRQYVTVRRLGNTPGAILFEGVLNVPKAGEYHFRMATDDSARLVIGEQVVVQTPAEYSYRRAAGKVSLKAGEHPFRLEYLNLASYAILELEWSGPGLPWTTLSAVKDWPLPPPPPAIPAAGALSWNGSYIAHPVESLTESRVKFVGDPAGIRLTTVNAAAIFFQPLSLPVADRIRSGKVGREGVLLVGGDYLEGEILSIKDNVITLQTLLFGTKQYQGGSQAAAVFLQQPAKAREQWIVRTQLGTEIRLRKLEWDGSTLVVNQTPFRKFRLKSQEIHEIAFRSDANILDRAWERWAGMDVAQRQQTVAGQNQFNSVYKSRAAAKVYLAQLDEKWRRLEAEHVVIKEEERKLLAFMQSVETGVRKARAESAQAQSDYAIHLRDLHVDAHFLNPQLRRIHELAEARIVEHRKIQEAEQKALEQEKKTNEDHVAQYVKDRELQRQGHEKYAADRKTEYDKARGEFKADIKPVEITAAANQARKMREFAEARRNQARENLNRFTPARDDARTKRDEAKRRMDAARGQRDARARDLLQAMNHQTQVLKNGLDPTEKKMLTLRADYAAKSAVYHEQIGKESAKDQTRLDAVSDLQSVDRHVRDWEGQLRSAQSKLRQDEQNKTNASRDHERRRTLMETARKTLHNFVDGQERPALARLNATKERHDQLVVRSENAPDDKGVADQLKQAQEQLAKDLGALTAIRGKLNGVIGQYQSKLHDYSYHQDTSGRMEGEWIRTQGDIKLLEKFLAAKKARQSELKNMVGELTRHRTDRMNKTRQAKAEMDRALNVLNQNLAEHNRRLAEYGTAVSKRFDAVRLHEEAENTLLREQMTYAQAEALFVQRSKEWHRQEQVLKAAEMALGVADAAYKKSEAARTALKIPLDDSQNAMVGRLTAWREAVAQVTHFQLETVMESEKITGELEAGRRRWLASVADREVALKRLTAMEKDAGAARKKNETDVEQSTAKLKEVEAADKMQQAKQLAAIKMLADASNQLRDVRSREGAKQREWLEAVFQHERYRVQKRDVLGFE